MSEITTKLYRIISEAVHIAQEENRRKGIPNVYSLNGKLVWQLPDGTVTSVNPNEKR
jgi:hypothetical protein